MNPVERPMRPGAMVADIGLGVVFALGIAFTAYMLSTSWGKAYWAYDSAVAVVVVRLRCCASGGRCGPRPQV
ncbi:hypothetical protein [Spirillospora sp. CA-128828]|uniref:hypothetical protein n=1 Tax=Spirillospora sp. CA-128828 TaxID=3240033 RepID=UPI003D8D909B